MKKKILTLATVITLITGFVSCSNDDFEECLQKSAVISKSVKTRSTGCATIEEAKARLQFLNEKYNETYIIDEDAPAEEYNDMFFAVLENVMRRHAGLEPLPIEGETQLSAIQIIDDSSIDEINVATTSSTLEYEPVVDSNILYKAENSIIESFKGSYFTEVQPLFARYEYILSYSYTYGLNSRLYFEDFKNTTNYTSSNIIKNSINSSMSETEIEQNAQYYQLSYIDKSLFLETARIGYDTNNPEDTFHVDFSYSYQFLFGNCIVEVVAANNSHATSMKIVGQI